MDAFGANAIVRLEFDSGGLTWYESQTATPKNSYNYSVTVYTYSVGLTVTVNDVETKRAVWKARITYSYRASIQDPVDKLGKLIVDALRNDGLIGPAIAPK